MTVQNATAAAQTSGLTFDVLTALVFGSLSAAGGTFLLKLGATGNVGLTSYINPHIAAGLTFYGLGSLAWIYGMAHAPLSAVYPFTALTFVIVIACAYTFLGEDPSAAGLCGCALILMGLTCIAWGNR